MYQQAFKSCLLLSHTWVLPLSIKWCHKTIILYVIFMKQSLFSFLVRASVKELLVYHLQKSSTYNDYYFLRYQCLLRKCDSLTPKIVDYQFTTSIFKILSSIVIFPQLFVQLDLNVLSRHVQSYEKNIMICFLLLVSGRNAKGELARKSMKCSLFKSSESRFGTCPKFLFLLVAITWYPASDHVI